MSFASLLFISGVFRVAGKRANAARTIKYIPEGSAII
jgi:hypothetical protein